MPSDLERSSGPAGQAVANDYDSFAEAYAAETLSLPLFPDLADSEQDLVIDLLRGAVA